MSGSSSLFTPYGWLVNIHLIPHLTPRIREVVVDTQGNYDITASDYQLSLVTIMAVGFALGLLLLLGILICLLTRWCCPSPLPRTPSRYYVYIVLLLLGLSATMLSLSMLYRDTLSITDDVTTLANSYQGHVSELRDVELEVDAQKLQSLTAELSGTPMAQRVDSLKTRLAAVVLSGEVVVASTPRMDVSDETTYARDSAHLLEIVTFVVFNLQVLAIMALPFTKHRWVRWAFFIFACIFCLACAAGSGATLAGLTLVADMCVSPYSQVERYVNGDEERTYVSYYLECTTAALPYAWQQGLDTMQTETAGASGDIEAILNYMKMQGLDRTVAQEVQDNITAINVTIASSRTNLACPAVSASFHAIVSSLCNNSTPYLLTLVCALVLGSLLFFAAMVSVLVHTPPPVRSPRIRTGETQPLLDVQEVPDARCKICMNGPVDVCLRPCGHLCCQQCAQRLTACPFCRGPINERLAVFV